MSFNIEKIRSDFPQISHAFQGHKILYFDNAATTLKPKSVVDLDYKYYAQQCSNVHRGIHTLSEEATNLYENTRDLLKEFINAEKREEIIFTKGTTESLNLIALTWGNENINENDEIIISEMEHHSNIVPWQMLCERKNANLKIIPVNEKGELIFEEYCKLLSSKTKLVSCVYISNALGTINPIAKMIKEAKKHGALFSVDAAQASTHAHIDVQALDCDFLSLSAHKMFGPTGVGILYGKEKILNATTPLFGGGDMINTVTFEKTTYNVLPQKFEAGTPNIAGVIAWAPAILYINELGIDNIKTYEDDLLNYATDKMKSVPGLRIVGEAQNKTSVISFVIENLHPHDIATIANKYHIALRTGHHCTQPLMKKMGVPATARASFSIYNTKEEIDELYKSLIKITQLFG